MTRSPDAVQVRWNHGEHEHVIYVPPEMTNLWQWDIWGDWEITRWRSICATLSRHDHVWDIGAEYGWMSVILAHIVSTSHLTLFEPSMELWPGIMAIFEANNHLRAPVCVPALVGDCTTTYTASRGWPIAAHGIPIPTTMSYGVLPPSSSAPTIPNIVSLDRYLSTCQRPPTVLHIDVEGSEYEVMRGARDLLSTHHPLVYISIHPDLMEKRGTSPDLLHEYMDIFGYRGFRLGIDHEEHWVYYYPHSALPRIPFVAPNLPLEIPHA